MTIVAFQGEHGAFSEEAIYQHFGNEVTPLPCRAFEDIFDAVVNGQADYAAVPVENSTAGSINKSFDLLFDHDLKVHGEILLRVRYVLFTLPGKGKEITQIRAHHQSLAQCETYINRHHYTAVPWYDSAGAAKDLVANPEEGIGIVASRVAAEHYGLEIIDEDIEDFKNNYTRFFVVGKGDAPRAKRSKTSIVFAVPEQPGTLYEALEQFASRQINLTKLESRPRRNRLWEYIFYLDFDGHYQDRNASDALVGLLSKAAFVKLLGSYPAAQVTIEDQPSAQSTLLQI
ncbi:MAG: prephenate dehydratase [Caldilineaceae bacterium]|nr:prephenate dehydratase [Caldilineaceae bacterium]